MFKNGVLKCLITTYIITVYCYGIFVAGPQSQKRKNIPDTEQVSLVNRSTHLATIQKLYSLLNHSLLLDSLLGYPRFDDNARDNKSLPTQIPVNNTENQSDAPPWKNITISNNQTGESTEKRPPISSPKKSNLSANLQQDIAVTNGSEAGMEFTTTEPLQVVTTVNESSLENNPRKPSFSGQFSSEQLEQHTSPDDPWPASPPLCNSTVENRFQDTITKLSEVMTTPSKSPLEYHPQKPSFAGQFSSGQIGLILPNGKPWPANQSISNLDLEDRLQTTNAAPERVVITTHKSSLEYNPQKPSYAGQFSSGYLTQLIPPGKPWPASPPLYNSTVENRFQETTTKLLEVMTTPSKSPLEYHPQKPSFAGQFSSGQIGLILPTGKPWPENQSISNPNLEDRLQTNNAAPERVVSTTHKSSLEYNPQKPSYAGQFSSGYLTQLIPPGKPWPARPPSYNSTVENRFQETTTKLLEVMTTPSKSPLEYHPQNPSFAGQFSSGQIGLILPTGKPWPANQSISNLDLENRLQTAAPERVVSTTPKSSLEYNPQKPSYAGPPGEPWPAGPPLYNSTVENVNLH